MDKRVGGRPQTARKSSKSPPHRRLGVCYACKTHVELDLTLGPEGAGGPHAYYVYRVFTRYDTFNWRRERRPLWGRFFLPTSKSIHWAPSKLQTFSIAANTCGRCSGVAETGPSQHLQATRRVSYGGAPFYGHGESGVHHCFRCLRLPVSGLQRSGYRYIFWRPASVR